jgi:predicted DNA-binding transcriptional regulator AlpA
MADRVSKKRGIPDALANFDSLPDSAYVRQPVVEGLFGCSGATVWRGVKKGSIPPPDKLSERISGWNVGKLRRALAAKKAA